MMVFLPSVKVNAVVPVVAALVAVRECAGSAAHAAWPDVSCGPEVQSVL